MFSCTEDLFQSWISRRATFAHLFNTRTHTLTECVSRYSTQQMSITHHYWPGCWGVSGAPWTSGRTDSQTGKRLSPVSGTPLERTHTTHTHQRHCKRIISDSHCALIISYSSLDVFSYNTDGSTLPLFLRIISKLIRLRVPSKLHTTLTQVWCMVRPRYWYCQRVTASVSHFTVNTCRTSAQ